MSRAADILHLLTENDYGDDEDDEAERERYTTGECHALALALHARSGLPLVALTLKEGRKTVVVHVMVEISQRTYLDVDGVVELPKVLMDADIYPDDDYVVQEVTPAILSKWARRGLLALVTPSMLRAAEKTADRIIAGYRSHSA